MFKSYFFSGFISAGQFGEEYKARYQLAQYLKGDEDDTWLVDHFFSTCLDVSVKVQDDEGKMEAEGHCNVGLCLQNNSKYCLLSIDEQIAEW